MVSEDVARGVAIWSGEPVAREAAPATPGFVALRARFGLSALELDVVRVALAGELEPALRGWPSVGALHRQLAAAGLDDVRPAVLPAGHLVQHGVIELVGDAAFPRRRVRLPASFWPRLVGWPATLPFAVAPAGAVPLAQLVIAPAARDAIAAAVAQARAPGAWLVISGAPDASRALVAAAVAGALGYATLTADAVDALPALRREASWLGAAVVVDGIPATLTALLRALPTLVIILADAPPAAEVGAVPGRRRIDLALPAPTPEEAEALWRHHLGDAVDLAIARRGGPSRIAAVAALAKQRADERAVTAADLRWAARLGQASTSGLVQPLATELRLTDVVMPASTRRELELARTWARHGGAAFRSAAAGRHLRGDAGLVCLFHGPPGTGKTMAARALAGELELELLRVDLSQVVNKYIGETEKNLGRVFDEAEATGAALFFDEADALFGKRSEVKDAHDRYANIETSFLLQRLEASRGLCILASNLRQHMDDAFSRRIQIVAEFVVPGPDERLQIWERHLVAGALGADVELAAVARQFALAGGDIRNAAASALVMATAEAQALTMRHLVIAIWRELRKSGRLTTADDFGAWRDVVINHARS